MRAILDTSVVIAHDVPKLHGELAISAATLAELHFGVLVTNSPMIRAERLRRLTVLQHRFEALPVDDAVAVSYGMLAAAVARPATALTHYGPVHRGNRARARRPPVHPQQRRPQGTGNHLEIVPV